MTQVEEEALTCPRFVVDNGTFSTKCGLSGEESPNLIKFQNHDTKTPLMKNGQIENFEKFPEYLESCLKQSFNNFLNNKNKKNYQIKDESFKLFITEKVLTPKSNREKLIKIAFESLKCKEYYVGIDSMLSLYASGITTGAVVNFNYNNTTIACAYEGYMLPHSVKKNDNISHITLENYLCKLINENEMNKGVKINIEDKSHRDIIRKIKENECYVSVDTIEEEEKRVNALNNGIKSELYFDYIINSLHRNHQNIKNLKLKYVPNELLNLCSSYFTNKYAVSKYKLPDGTVFYVGNEKFKCMEQYFNGDLRVQKILNDSTRACDMDIQFATRKAAVVNGSLSVMNGMKERIKFNHNEFLLSKYDSIVVNCKKYSAWTGGSVLASLTTFGEMWVTKDEYNENGPAIVHRKCF